MEYLSSCASFADFSDTVPPLVLLVPGPPSPRSRSRRCPLWALPVIFPISAFRAVFDSRPPLLRLDVVFNKKLNKARLSGGLLRRGGRARGGFPPFCFSSPWFLAEAGMIDSCVCVCLLACVYLFNNGGNLVRACKTLVMWVVGGRNGTRKFATKSSADMPPHLISQAHTQLCVFPLHTWAFFLQYSV